MLIMDRAALVKQSGSEQGGPRKPVQALSLILVSLVLFAGAAAGVEPRGPPQTPRARREWGREEERGERRWWGVRRPEPQVEHEPNKETPNKNIFGICGVGASPSPVILRETCVYKSFEYVYMCTRFYICVIHACECSHMLMHCSHLVTHVYMCTSS